VWAGKKRADLFTAEERDAFFDVCRQAAKLAEDAGVVLCMECHRNSYTETKGGALELMQAVNSPAFRMYFQPNQTLEENMEYIQVLRPYIDNLHVFHMKDHIRCPLSTGEEEWKTYLGQFAGDRAALLEFMPDGQVESLPVEAQTLRRIAAAF
jgi:sugar phosphate isomerase/epimerase